jgi:hypothetical protein
MPHFNKPASVALPSDSNQGLYDPAFERDSCWVGFVADVNDPIAKARGLSSDCRRGQSLVLWAIAEGREAARHIDHYLTGQFSTLRARDRPLVQIEPLPRAVPDT